MKKLEDYFRCWTRAYWCSVKTTHVVLMRNFKVLKLDFSPASTTESLREHFSYSTANIGHFHLEDYNELFFLILSFSLLRCEFWSGRRPVNSPGCRSEEFSQVHISPWLAFSLLALKWLKMSTSDIFIILWFTVTCNILPSMLSTTRLSQINFQPPFCTLRLKNNLRKT